MGLIRDLSTHLLDGKAAGYHPFSPPRGIYEVGTRSSGGMLRAMVSKLHALARVAGSLLLSVGSFTIASCGSETPRGAAASLEAPTAEAKLPTTSASAEAAASTLVSRSASATPPLQVAESAPTGPSPTLLDSPERPRSKSGIPAVVVHEPTVGPAYAPELISRVIAPAKRALLRCSERHASDPASSAGTLRFTIGADGAVKKAEFVRSDIPLKPDARQECILGVVRGLAFPAPNGGSITVTYPIAADPT